MHFYLIRIIQLYSMKVLLIGLILVLAASQDLINRVKIEGSQTTGACWLGIVNTEQILDFRTDCLLGNSTERPGYERMIQFVKPKAAYLIKQKGRNVWGYRYFKDPLNYMFAYYNFTTYELSFSEQISKLGLSSVRLPFDERYTLNLEYLPISDEWKLTSLSVKYNTAQSFSIDAKEYNVHTWMQKAQTVEKSMGTRRIFQRGDFQPVNITIELSPLDEQIVESSQGCRVVIEQIMPEWFFISYDDLHTMDHFEVFDIELPAHFAKQYFFRYYPSLSKFTKMGNKYSLVYPMRVRYPPPGDDYVVTVGLHPNDKITMECGPHVFEIEEDLLVDRGHKEMFSGKESDTQMVTMATYAISLIACVWSLKKHKKACGM